MKLWFHDHLVDEITDLVCERLDEYPQTVQEYQAVRNLYEDRSSFDLFSLRNDMRYENELENQ